jgi:hypothetical protein
MTKYLLTILCSNNIELLKISFESAINQINYSNYDIFIVINTLNENFYKEVINFYKENKHPKLKKIIRSESNGKPGKGHNSLLDIFKVELDYEYLLILDGDDFYYPCALERINFLNEHYNFDSLFLVGNSKIFKNKEEEHEKNTNECSTNEYYNLNTKYTISKYENIGGIGKDFNNIIATPFRLISTNRKILERYNKLFDENMKLYDDYYQYLLIYKLLEENNFVSKDIKIKLINDSYIYLYNKFNECSLSNSYNLKNDIKLANELKKKLNINNLDNEKLNVISIESHLNNNDDFLKKIEDNFYKWIIYKTYKL